MLQQHGTWMDLEIIILSEVNQTETQTSYDITYMWNLKKNDTNELIYKTETDSDLENELMVSRGKGGEGRTDWESGIDMYTLLYLK